MAEYALTLMRKVGNADMYEVRLPDGSSNRFIYSGAQHDEAFDRWVEIAVRRARRDSEYMTGRTH